MYARLGEGLLPPSSGFTSALVGPDLGGMHGGSRDSSGPSSVLGSSPDLRTGCTPTPADTRKGSSYHASAGLGTGAAVGCRLCGGSGGHNRNTGWIHALWGLMPMCSGPSFKKGGAKLGFRWNFKYFF